MQASGDCGHNEPEQETQSTDEFHDTMGKLLDTFDVNEFAASVKIFAAKPA